MDTELLLAKARKSSSASGTLIPDLVAAHISGCVPRGLKKQLCSGMSKRLFQARERTGLSASAVAAAANLSHPTARKIEDGRIPALDTLERLAAVIGVPPGWLAYGPEGGEPFKPRRPRSITHETDPEPSERWRAYRARHEGCPDRLRRAREASGLSMRELAAAAGITHQTWSNTETGSTVPKVDSLERMAVALGVSPSWLAYGYEDEHTGELRSAHD
jgi:transcriptional regulator with XRE-family HTH domain